VTATIDEVEAPEAFFHEAFFYDSDHDYVDGAVPFIEEGLDLGQPILVAVPRKNLDLLRPRFEGAAAALLRFADMEEMGRNPSWIIPAWHQFAAPHVAAGRPARVIGEPIWASRTPDELVECGRHEALINLAFAEAAGFNLLCPYDLSSLDGTIIDEAHRNHPEIGQAGHVTKSPQYDPHVPAVLETPLPPVPGEARWFDFAGGSTRAIRETAASLAAAAGVSQLRIGDLVVAVSEALANSVRHGGGAGRIAMWCDGRRILCEIRDHGRISDPLAGRVRPAIEQPDGRGLWLMNQLCDLVQIRALAGGQVVRLQMSGDHTSYRTA
jgi:anti-sigma regulatory factor (Ser/Thr protein kinase)